MAESLSPGTLIAGRYRLERRLDSSGLGTSWSALDQPTGVRFLVRVLDSAGLGGQEARDRFLRTIDAAKLLQSEHLVLVFDHGEWEGSTYIVTELLEGEDLAARLRRETKLDPDETYRIVAQVAAAFTRAHAAGIVHGDLRPEHIFLVRDEGDSSVTVKVLDFGVARRGSGDRVDRSTRIGSFSSAPHYVSPEQAVGKPSDHRSDLWSLGAIAYHCLTGHAPFEGDSHAEVLARIGRDRIPTLRENNPDLSYELEPWCKNALSRDPQFRFRSAMQLSESLAAAIERSRLTPMRPPQALAAAERALAAGRAAQSPRPFSSSKPAPAEAPRPSTSPKSTPAAEAAPAAKPTPSAQPVAVAKTTSAGPSGRAGLRGRAGSERPHVASFWHADSTPTESDLPSAMKPVTAPPRPTSSIPPAWEDPTVVTAPRAPEAATTSYTSNRASVPDGEPTVVRMANAGPTLVETPNTQILPPPEPAAATPALAAPPTPALVPPVTPEPVPNPFPRRARANLFGTAVMPPTTPTPLAGPSAEEVRSMFQVATSSRPPPPEPFPRAVTFDSIVAGRPDPTAVPAKPAEPEFAASDVDSMLADLADPNVSRPAAPPPGPLPGPPLAPPPAPSALQANPPAYAASPAPPAASPAPQAASPPYAPPLEPYPYTVPSAYATPMPFAAPPAAGAPYATPSSHPVPPPAYGALGGASSGRSALHDTAVDAFRPSSSYSAPAEPRAFGAAPPASVDLDFESPYETRSGRRRGVGLVVVSAVGLAVAVALGVFVVRSIAEQRRALEEAHSEPLGATELKASKPSATPPAAADVPSEPEPTASPEASSSAAPSPSASASAPASEPAKAQEEPQKPSGRGRPSRAPARPRPKPASRTPAPAPEPARPTPPPPPAHTPKPDAPDYGI